LKKYKRYSLRKREEIVKKKSLRYIISLKRKWAQREKESWPNSHHKVQQHTTERSMWAPPRVTPYEPPRFEVDDPEGYAYLDQHGYAVFKDVLTPGQVRSVV
jgi:hypothetical protein